jgi:hypothetical protein
MIRRGTYKTECGYTAYVWEKREQDGQTIWIGRVNDQGATAWDERGKNMYGVLGWNIVLPDSEDT